MREFLCFLMTASEKSVKPLHQLAFQMVLWFSALSLIPLSVATYLNYVSAADSLKSFSDAHLRNLLEQQSEQIDEFIASRSELASVMAQTPAVIGSFSQGDHFLKPLQNLVSIAHFDNIYLINKSGEIVLSLGDHTVASGNLMLSEERARPSILAKVYSLTLSSQNPQISVLEPTGSVESPVMFFTAPVYAEGGSLLGVLALQVNAEQVYGLVNNYTGLGSTGEILLVRKHGEDILLLNPLRNAQQLSFQYLDAAKAEGTPMQTALKGDSGSGHAVDYWGRDVFAAWTHLPRTDWGLVVKMDEEELLAPAASLRQLSLFIGISTFIVVLAAAIIVSSSITQPITALTSIASRIAKGDLTPFELEGPKNEIGILGQALEIMRHNLCSLVDKVKRSGHEVAMTTQEVAHLAEFQEASARSTGKASMHISTLARNISATSKELTGTMQEVNELAQDTALLAESGIQGLQSVESPLDEITHANKDVARQIDVIKEKANAAGGIITAMAKVADQTNLLSLNAAIEARKAGKQGGGFKVVAREISSLAEQAAKSTVEIEAIVSAMLDCTAEGAQVMQKLSGKVKYGVQEILTMSKQLTAIIQQVQSLPPRFEIVLQKMKTQESSADTITQSIEALTHSAQKTIGSLENNRQQLEALIESSTVLQEEISQFRT